MRIGIIGTENSHADHYVRHFNDEKRHAEHRVVGLSGGRSERNTKLAAAGGIDLVVDEPKDLLEHVDTVIICSRHGGQHRAEAEPFLSTGKPVLVDKPLACSVSDAQAVLKAAQAGDALVTSYSALRWAPEVSAYADRLASFGTPEVLSVAGPADPTSEYGGIFFYGVHVAEIALRLAGISLGEVAVAEYDDEVIATAQAGPTRLVLGFQRPREGVKSRWRITATAGDRSLAEEIQLGPDYAAPATETYVRMLDEGVVPLTNDELLAPVRLLSTVDGALSA